MTRVTYSHEWSHGEAVHPRLKSMDSSQRIVFGAIECGRGSRFVPQVPWFGKGKLELQGQFSGGTCNP